MDSRFDKFRLIGEGLHDHQVPAHVKRLTFHKLSDGAQLPMKAHATDTGYDLFLDKHHEFLPGKNTLATTGIGVDLDEGFTALILGRSSTLNKHGIIVYPGLIDQDYQGELLISVFTPSDKYVNVEKGTRIAQLVLMRNEGFDRVPVWRIEPEQATERGTGGFGSSG